MWLAASTHYAPWMLVWLANAPAGTLSTAALAHELGPFCHHLIKIMQDLARAGIVRARPRAAFARPPAGLGLGCLARQREADQSLVVCLATGQATCSIGGRCRLDARLRAAELAFLADLDLPPKGQAASR